MIDWRHPCRAANFLLQDSHVTRVQYNVSASEPVNTTRFFLWRPGEPLGVTPQDSFESNLYPNVPPVNLLTGESDGVFPREMVPGYYTYNKFWTAIY